MSTTVGIDIDKELLRKAMEISGTRTEKDVVAQAVEEYVNVRTRKDLRELVGKIRFADGYEPKESWKKALGKDE